MKVFLLTMCALATQLFLFVKTNELVLQTNLIYIILANVCIAYIVQLGYNITKKEDMPFLNKKGKKEKKNEKDEFITLNS